MFHGGLLRSLRPHPRHVTRCSVARTARAAAVYQQVRSLNHFIRPSKDGETIIAHEADGHSGSKGSEPGHGLRLAVKDNIATRDTTTTCASNILRSYQSPFNATIVRQLREQWGAQVLPYKTNLDEFGMGSHSTHSAFGPVAQEISSTGEDTLVSAGGSSGGSAVAVQTGEADLALGTDTGGSIRLPAAYCGLVGYKPSYGMISRYGVIPYANSLDTVGFLAKKVASIEQVISGKGGLYKQHDPLDPTSLSVASRKRCTAQRGGYGLRIGPPVALEQLTFGIPIEYNIEEIDEEIRLAWEAAAERLRALGARVVPVSLPFTKHALSAYYVIAPAEASSNLAKYDGVRYGDRPAQSDGQGGVLYAETRGLGFGEVVKQRILLGSYTLSSTAKDNYFLQAQKVRQLVRTDFDRVFKLSNPLRDEEDQHFSLVDLPETMELENKLGPVQVDFLLCPTAPTFAPTLEKVKKQTQLDAFMNDVFTVPASLAGLPAVSVPMPVEDARSGSDARNVAGLQIVGQYWDDARLLRVAEAISM